MEDIPEEEKEQEETELTKEPSREPSKQLSKEPSKQLSREPSKQLSREPSKSLSKQPSILSGQKSGELLSSVNQMHLTCNLENIRSNIWLYF